MSRNPKQNTTCSSPTPGTALVILREESLPSVASSQATSFLCLLPLPQPVCALGMQTNLTKAKHN